MISHHYFKTDKVRIRFQYLHPKMQEIAEEMVEWLLGKGIDPEITETVTTLKEDAAIGRVSDSHRKGRAIDIRTRNWPRPLVKIFETHFEKKYGSLGAIGATTGVPNFLLFHDIGHGEHYHAQLNKKFTMVMPNELEPIKKEEPVLPEKKTV